MTTPKPPPNTTPGLTGFPKIDPDVFIAKWKNVDFGEKQASQEMFLDICALVGHPTPSNTATGTPSPLKSGCRAALPTLTWKGVSAVSSRGSDDDLAAALNQLMRYQVHLKTPPLLIVSSVPHHTYSDQLPRHGNGPARDSRRRIGPTRSTPQVAVGLLLLGRVPAQSHGGRRNQGDRQTVPSHRGGHGAAHCRLGKAGALPQPDCILPLLRKTPDCSPAPPSRR